MNQAHGAKGRFVAATTLRERFDDKWMAEPMSGCWLWTAGLSAGGYGVISTGRHHSAPKFAHRVAWALYRGPVPDGLRVLHRCDNRVCVNPEHLFLGTLKDNTQDMLAKGRNRPPRGSRNGQARLKEGDVVVIKRRLAAGHTQRDVARDFAMAEATIWAIAHGKLWRHV